MKPLVRVLAAREDVVRAARERFVEIGCAAITARGRFDVALAGGTTPEGLYRALTPSDLDWSRVRVFFGDERCVPPEHDDSNYRMARETLLSRVPIPDTSIQRMPGEIEPARAAKSYELALAASFAAGLPRFDLCLLGIGADGHTASLFPGTTALAERERACVATWVEKLDAWRLTLTFPVIDNSAHVVFLVCGSDKADALELAVVDAPTAATPPSGCVRPTNGTLEWIVDRAAAAAL